ncbi:MAG: IS4 family transposase [Acidobacteria bacterium]|nr:IS4 family transposase [Acidobacteriota bacterium]
MPAPTAKQRLRPAARSLVDCLREFLTPAVWKQAQKHRPTARPSRWKTQPLLLTLLFMTWCCGDWQAERFETAKACCVACLPRRRRPGRTVQGFQKALAQLPTGVLRAVAAGVRQTLALRCERRGCHAGFIPIGCDGSRVECPRTPELEQRLGRANKDRAAPSLWVTALVHLRWGVPWAWRIGKGTASERSHLLQMLAMLPAAALVVADAGYFGFELCQRLLAARVCFLVRMSSNVTLYTAEQVRLERYREGLVYYWPGKEQKKGSAPLRLRLLRIRAKKKKNDVWLLTNVLEPQRLSAATAATFYRWRWENEGQFRAYKRTLGKVKLASRTVRLVHREAEGSLLALQLLLAQGVWAMPAKSKRAPEPVCSPRQVLLALRQALTGLLHGQPVRYGQRLRRAQRERRVRTSAKAARPWPRRKPHKPPQPPKILTLSAAQRSRIARLEQATA